MAKETRLLTSCGQYEELLEDVFGFHVSGQLLKLAHPFPRDLEIASDLFECPPSLPPLENQLHPLASF